MELIKNNKDLLPVEKVGRVSIRAWEGRGGVHYQMRIVIPAEFRVDEKREKTRVWINSVKIRGKALRLRIEEEARNFEEETFATSNKRVLGIDCNVTLSDYLLHFKRVKETNGVKHNTILYYDNMSQRVCEFYGSNIKITDITTSSINNFLSWLSTQESNVSKSATPTGSLKNFAQSHGVTQKMIAEEAKISIKTVEACYRGDKISYDNSMKIYNAMLAFVNDQKHLSIVNEKRANKNPPEPPLVIPKAKYTDFFNVNEPERLSQKTIKEHYVFLHAVLEMAVEEDIIEKNPMKKGQKPKVDRAEAEYYTPEEIKKILAAIDKEAAMGIAPYKWKAFVYLLAHTGARRGEITGLKWSSIDFSTGEMTISRATSYSSEKKEIYEHTPKSATSCRVLVLGQEVLGVLAEYRKEYEEIRSKAKKWIEKGFMFVQKNGNPISPGAIDDWLVGFEKRNDLPHLYPHKFRHSCATNLIHNNEDIVSISRMLGHSRPSVTSDMYCHAKRDNNRGVCSALSDIYSARKDKKE